MNILKFYQTHKRCINQHLWFENVARGKIDLDNCGQAMAALVSALTIGTVCQIWSLLLLKEDLSQKCIRNVKCNLP